jgi:hypothetical protein
MTAEERDSERGICRDGGKFLQILSEMEEKNEIKREISGAIEGPFFSRAVFHCIVRMGFEDEVR